MKKNLLTFGIALFLGMTLVGCGHSHDFSKLIPQVDAKCTETGLAAHYECSCGKVFDVNKQETTVEQLVIKATGHQYDDNWVIDTDPSCLGKGHKHKDCVTCGQAGRIEEDIDPVGHKLELVAAVSPTCGTPGHKAYYKCSRSNCDLYTLDAEGKNVIADFSAWIGEGGDGYIAPTGNHVYEENPLPEFIVSEADCENAAVYYKSCSCGKTNGETFVYGDALGHEYEFIEKLDKTCTEDGLDTHYECSRCHQLFDMDKNKVAREDLIIPAGHTLEEDPAVSPTFAKEGHIHGYTCKLCQKHFADEQGTTPISDEDWNTPILSYEEDLDKVVFYDLSTKKADDAETGLKDYEYVGADKKPLSETLTEVTPGETTTCFAYKEGEKNYKISVLVVSKVIKTADEFVSALNTKVVGGNIEGYYVLGNDIEGLSINQGFDQDGRITATFDGRGHTISSIIIQGSGGLFSGQYQSKFTVKNVSFEDVETWGYGLFGYISTGLTLENVNITSKTGSVHADSLLSFKMSDTTMKNCYIDNLSNASKPIADEFEKIKLLENTTIARSFHSQQVLCNKLDGAAYEEKYDEEGINWEYIGYEHQDAANATFKEGGHIAGYYCSECDKHFSDANHTHEVSDAEWYNSSKLPTTKVEGKKLFYNLATAKVDNAEVPGVVTSELLDGNCEEPDFTGLKAGDTFSLYSKGETNYEYEALAVTNVIASEDDWNEHLSGVDHNVTGYYVLTADIESLTTKCGANNGGSDHTNTTLVNVTIDGRGHTISNLKVTSKTGGMFGTCGTKGAYFLTIKNLIVASAKRTQYGFLGYCPANGGDATNHVTFENFDLTVGEGYTNGVFAFTNPSAKFTFKDCRIDMRKGATKLFHGGGSVSATFEGTTTILVNTAWDTNAATCCEIVKGNLANERDGLTSKIPGVVFAAE